MKNEKSTAKPQNRLKDFFRKSAVVFLVFLTALSLNLGVSAVWLKHNIVNTDTWVTKTTDIIKNPDVRQQISTRLADQIFAQADVQKYVEQILPEQIGGLAAPLTQSLEDRTATQIDSAMQSEAFLQFWSKASRSAHQGVIDSLENSGSATPQTQEQALIYIDNDSLVLNLKPVFASVKTRLSEQGLSFVDRFSGDRITGSITLAKIDNMQSLLAVFDIINKRALLLPLAAVASTIGALALTKSKRRVLIAIGSVTALFMVANVQLVYLAKYPIVNSIASSLTSTNTASAEAVFNIISRDLVTISRTLLVASLLLVLGGLLAGPSKMAAGIRNGVGNLLSPKQGNSPAINWIASNANALVGMIGGLAVLLLLVPIASEPTYAISVVLIAVLLSFATLSIKQANEE